MVIRRVGPVSCAKLGGILYASFAFVVGAIFSLVSLLHVYGAGEADPTPVPALFGTAAVVLMPALYGGLGFVFSLLAAVLYNGVARLVGGLRIEVESE